MTAVDEARQTLQRLNLFIDGKWRAGADGFSESVINPATEESLGLVPHATATDLEEAVAAAVRGFAVWSQTPAAGRRVILLKAAALVRERIEHIAHVLTLEQGKPLIEAKGEIIAAAEIFEWYADEAQRLYGRVVPARMTGVRQVVLRQPVGPVAAFTPWNFPALTPARKIAGALAAGCSCIIKAAEETPGTCIELARALDDAGLPAGVLNLVFGVPADISTHLIRHPEIRKISFTGSIAVGQSLAAMAAQNGTKRCTLELGGHAPVLVFADADVEKAAEIAALGRMRNAGQVCVAPSRFLVERPVLDLFTKHFVKAITSLKIGNGLDPSVQLGPLANRRRLDAMDRFVEDARNAGARIATGGQRLGNKGFFFPPTVLSEIGDAALAMREETFGPVAPIAGFDDLDEVICRANALPYGLAAYAFTRSAKTAHALSERIAAGMLGINHLAVSIAEAPFGGVKASGYGSEGGSEGLEGYLDTKFVSHLVQ